MRIPALTLLLATMHLPAAEVTIGRWGGALVVQAPAVRGDAGWQGPLSQRITLDARELPVAEVIGQLRTMTGANWVVDPELSADPSPITLQVRDMELAHVQRWIERQAGCTIVAMNQAWFVTRRPLPAATTMRIYDVSDLVLERQDFPGPELALQPGSRGGVQILPPVASAAPTTDDIADLLERLLVR